MIMPAKHDEIVKPFLNSPTLRKLDTVIRKNIMRFKVRADVAKFADRMRLMEL
jgi:hypothetical protein